MQPTLKEWLERKPKAAKPKKRLKPMSTKRKREARIYSQKRKAFLAEHPRCMAWAIIKNWQFSNGLLFGGISSGELLLGLPPPSEEIHHMKKPKCKYLNDESTWLAVSKWSHRWIEDYKNIAREIGLLA